MNLKKIYLISFLALALLLTMSAISAQDNATVALPDNDTQAVGEVISNDTAVSDNQVSTDKKADETKKPKTVKKIKTKVEAPQVAFKVKKSNYFKIKVENKYDDDIPIKKVKLNLKIYTGKKSKTYTVKTNSKGIAKFNTKNLKSGVHKVVISSGDEKYSISKQSKIIIGKEYSKILKKNVKRVLNKKDVAKIKIKYDDDEKEVKIVFKKAPKNTIVTKAKFYFKNKKTGKIITKTDKSEFDDGRWDWPDKDYSYKYTLIKVKVYYIKI